MKIFTQTLVAVFLLFMVSTAQVEAEECSCNTGRIMGGVAGGAAGAYICSATVGLGALFAFFTGGLTLVVPAMICAGEIVGATNTGYDVGEKIEKHTSGCDCD